MLFGWSIPEITTAIQKMSGRCTKNVSLPDQMQSSCAEKGLARGLLYLNQLLYLIMKYNINTRQNHHENLCIP